METKKEIKFKTLSFENANTGFSEISLCQPNYFMSVRCPFD